MRAVYSPLLFLAVASCAASQQAVPDTILADSCRSEPAQPFLGQLATQQTGAAMLARTGARTLRWVGFGRMVTMDFRGDRLTVRLDQSNRIESANCG